jgi:CFEM domain
MFKLLPSFASIDTKQDKCITGTASSDVSSCPSFGCGSSSEVSAFSITEVQISVEFDCSIEFHYSMPGGSTCKQTSSCSSGGSIVKNTQCGGAKNVTVVYPSQSSGSGKGKSSCSIGLHSIGFDCSSASSTKYHSTTTSAIKYTTSIPTLTTSSTTQVEYTPSSSPSVSTSSTQQIETTSSTAQVTYSSPAASSSSISPVVSSYTTSSSASAIEVITTVIVDTTTTLCPVTLTHTTGGNTSIEVSTSTSTILVTTTKTVCTRCEAESTSSPLATTSAVVSSSPAVYIAPTSTTSSSGPVVTQSCPDVLPQCLNTWLFIEGCSSNTDTACFCPSTDFVANVFSCLSAYGASDTEISVAQVYFQGICAPYIPSNPAIVTCASSVIATVSQPPVPVTTVQIFTTIVVPCTETTGISSGYTIPGSSTTTFLSTQVVVPQVVFTTVGTSSGAAALVTGVPTIGNAGVATTPAQTTFAAVTSSSNGTIKASATPTQQTTSSAGKNSIAIGATFAAILFAVMIL